MSYYLVASFKCFETIKFETIAAIIPLHEEVEG
jgi:hypothetical protein